MTAANSSQAVRRSWVAGILCAAVGCTGANNAPTPRPATGHTTASAQDSNASGAVADRVVQTTIESPGTTASEKAVRDEAANDETANDETASDEAANAQIVGSATVEKVIDGDTFDVRMESGAVVRIRPLGVNTSETNQCFFGVAEKWVREHLLGTTITIRASNENEMDRDRYLRYVDMAGGGDFGLAVIDAGLGIAVGSATVYEDYLKHQRLAQEAQIGKWSPTACPSSTHSADQISHLRRAFRIEVAGNPSGHEDNGSNEEWVRVTNVTAETVDLSGFVLYDESSKKRFTFLDLKLAPDASVTVHSGVGTDTETDKYWGFDHDQVWNNGGDSVFLAAPAGALVFASDFKPVEGEVLTLSNRLVPPK